MERLDKFLCDSGVGTRSQVKQIIKSGRVTVDGRPEKDGSRKIDPAACRFCIFQKNTMALLIFDQRKPPPVLGQPGVFFDKQLRCHSQHCGNGINLPVIHMHMTGPSAAIPAPTALKPGHY